jgi:ribosomal subunit interface protein
MPRNARSSAHAVVTLRDTGSETDSKYACEVILHVPGDTIAAKESTLNQFAAVDIVEAKLKNQLSKYKQAHIGHIKGHRNVLRRVRERLFAAQPE